MRYFVCKRAEKSIQNFNDSIFVEKIKILALKFKKGSLLFRLRPERGNEGVQREMKNESGHNPKFVLQRNS